jgi:hypothetical protein
MTPAVNVNSTPLGILYDKFYANGVLIYNNPLVKIERHIRDTRPASINNPRRVDGTRPPSSWQRYGGAMGGVRGRYLRDIVIGADHYQYVLEGQLASPGLVPGSIPYLNNEGELTAIRKALGRFNGAAVQLGAALRETRQTVDMVGKYYRHANTLTKKLESAVSGSKRVRNQFRDFLRGSWKDAPGAYLEYLFGMKPLADDLTNAVQVLQDSKQHMGAFKMTLKGKYKEQDASSPVSYQSNIVYVTQVYGTQEVSQVSKASLVFQLPDWYWEKLPPVTFFQEGWATTRLSFVLDWVLPVNEFLMGFEGNQLRPFFREGSRSTMMRRQLFDVRVADPNWVTHDAPGGWDFSYNRVAFFAFPTEELFRLPRFRDVLGLDQLRVGSSLLAQRLASLSKAIGRH